MKLRWEKIEGFDGYWISDDGDVWSERRDKGNSPGILVGFTTDRGYRAVVIRDETGKPCRRSIHRLVALAFLPKPREDQTDVCHNDGNPTNCNYKNLRWDTHRNNQLEMRKHGTMQDGEKCCTAKLSACQVEDIRKKVAEGPRGTARRLAFELGMSIAQISRIVNGKRWTSTYGRDADHDRKNTRKTAARDKAQKSGQYPSQQK